MKLKIKLVILFLLTSLIGLFPLKTAFAANFSLSGKVTDNSSSPIVGATVSVNNVIYDTPSGAADTADPTTALTSGNVKVH